MALRGIVMLAASELAEFHSYEVIDDNHAVVILDADNILVIKHIEDGDRLMFEYPVGQIAEETFQKMTGFMLRFNALSADEHCLRFGIVDDENSASLFADASLARFSGLQLQEFMQALFNCGGAWRELLTAIASATPGEAPAPDRLMGHAVRA